MRAEGYNCDENAIFSKLSEVEILFNQPILDVTKTGSYVFKFKPDELDDDQLINSNEIRFKKDNTVSVSFNCVIRGLYCFTTLFQNAYTIIYLSE